ncbi:hypothetical protein ACFXAW_33165 [Streptomyces sp. NPDC059445]|uniref:hypothetical protein n=1 Tax=Streptomyces sp. NPDC059445 TaxID=3346832 RepID=UPI0036791AC6
MRGLREVVTVMGALGAAAAVVVSAAPAALAGPPANPPMVASAVRQSADYATQGTVGDSPDIVLTVAGDTGRTTTLHSGDPDFGRLWRLLSPRYEGPKKTPAEWADGRLPVPEVTVIWGVTGAGGDVAIERQDQVFLTADGEPWVRSDLAPDLVGGDFRWHRAPQSVLGQLTQEGRLFGSGSGAVASSARVEPDPAAWALPGLVAGLAIGAGATWFVRRAKVRQVNAGSAADTANAEPLPEPRQELVKV